NESGSRPAAGRGPGRQQYLAPYGDARPDNILIPMALRKQRRMAEFGNGAEEYGYVSLNGRRWGSMNDEAELRDLIDMDEYLSSRAVVDPLLLLDCDYPTTAACATIVTSPERSRDLRQPPVN